METGWSSRAAALLSQNVDGQGRFHYEREGVEADLSQVLASFADQDPRGFRTPDEELAFWLNAYNLAALAIAARWYRGSNRIRRQGLGGWWSRFRFFFLEGVRIARRRRTLFGLEFFTIRRRFLDPRIHFALVCATNGCPPLRNGLYSGDRLGQELDQAARGFLRPGVGYRLDRNQTTITFNRIFRWYAADFRRVGGPLGALERWGPPSDVEYVRPGGARVRYATYDWHLNDAGAVTSRTPPRAAALGRSDGGPPGDSAGKRLQEPF